MQHIEDAGIHSGDSACVLPPYLITEAQVEEMRQHTRAFAERLGVVGLLNVQYAIKHGVVYVLEVNPRASRTVPFVSKTTGVPLAGLAAAVMAGEDARRAGPARRRRPAVRGGEGSGLPVQQAAGRGSHPRPRDALHRRGHGHRRLVRDGVRQGADLRRRRAAARGRDLRHGERPRQGARGADRRGGSTSSASGSSRPRAPRGTSAQRGIPAERVLKVHEGRPNAIDLLRLGPGPAADQHAARQADASRTTTPSAGRRCSTGCPTPRRCRPRRPRATRSSRSGAARARSGRSRSGTRWRGRCRPNGPADRPRPAASRRRCATRVRGEVREDEPLARYSTYRIGGPATVLLPAAAGGRRRRRSGLAHEAGVPWFALGPRLQHPAARRGARRAGHPARARGSTGCEQDGDRWTVGAGLPAPLAARRTAAAGFGGLHIFVGVPGTVGGGVYMNAGCHGGDWSEVVEQVTVVDADGRGRRCSLAREIPFTYRRSGLDGRIVLEADGAAPPGGAGAARRADRRDVRVAAAGHAVQPAVLRQRLQESRGPELEAGGRAADRGPADRGGRPQGHADRRRARSRRCTRTTSSTPAGDRGRRPRADRAGAAGRRGEVRRAAGARGQADRTSRAST